VSWLREQADRDRDPATPPWLTVHFYLAISGVIAAITVIILNSR
jgi:hypothetical protein